MKILIAADMEGITGVVSWDHVRPDHTEYARFRKLMTADVKGAEEALLAYRALRTVVALARG